MKNGKVGYELRVGEEERMVGEGDGLHDDSKCGPATTEKGLPGGFFMTSYRHKINFRWSPPPPPPVPAGGAYDAPPDPLVRWEDGRPLPISPPHSTSLLA